MRRQIKTIKGILKCSSYSELDKAAVFIHEEIAQDRAHDLVSYSGRITTSIERHRSYRLSDYFDLLAVEKSAGNILEITFGVKSGTDSNWKDVFVRFLHSVKQLGKIEIVSISSLT